MSAFLVMLREGVEAALIVAILLAYLNRLNRREDARWVWAGTWAAVAVSLVAGVAVHAAIGELEGAAEEVTEGVIAFLAAAVLTTMVFWMARQARAMKSKLELEVDTAISGGSTLALAAIAFTAVVREGLESALLLISTTIGPESGAQQLTGAVLGLAAAAVIGYLFYRGSRRVNLRTFFRVTGVLVILFAAGLVSKGIHELQEAGALGTMNEHLWTTTIADPSTSFVGEVAAGLFGWSPSPSVEMVVGYFLYLVPVLGLFIIGTRARAAAPARVPAGRG